ADKARNENTAGVLTPLAVAAIVSVPGVLPNVYPTLVEPSAPVVDVGALSAPVPAVRDQLTDTASLGLLNWSTTRTTSASCTAWRTVSVWPLPDTTLIDAGTSARAVAGTVTLNVAAV